MLDLSMQSAGIRHIKWTTPTVSAVVVILLAVCAALAHAASMQEKAPPAHDCTPAGMEALPVETDPEFTEKVMQQLASDEPAERIQALSQLSVKQPPVDPGLLADMLYQALNDPDAFVRGQAVYAMAKQGDIGYLSALQQALADPELQVRLMALDGLVKNEWGRLLLEQALQDDDENVRGLAAEKLLAFASR